MLRSPGERFASAGRGLCAHPPTAASAINSKVLTNRITFLPFSRQKSSWPLLSGGHEAGLLDRAKPLRLATASRLTWAYVMAVPPAVGRLHVRKGRAVAYLVDVDAIADARAELYWVGQDAGHGARCDVHDVIIESASIWEASIVPRQEPQALLTAGSRGRNASIQSKQIGDRARVLRPASWTDRSLVLDQREQVGARRGCHWDAKGPKEMSQKRIEEEVSELAIVLRVIHAEAVFRPGADDQFVDQRVAFALYLLPRAFGLNRIAVLYLGGRAADGNALARRRPVRPDPRILVAGRMKLAIHRQHSDWYFQHDRVHVEACYGIGRIVVGIVGIHLRAQDAADAHAEVQGIKRRSEVDKEGIVHCSCKYPYTVA